MLETILQIGKTLRQSKRLQHHRYIKRAPLNNKKTSVAYFSLPVREDFSFDLDNVTAITDEDFIKHQLYYLTYKTSGSDNQVKYLFGDINFGISQKDGYIPGTYYQLAETDKTSHKRKSSFERGDSEVDSFKGSIIEKFRKSFSTDKDWIENFLKKNGEQQICYLHFDFQGKHWYEFSDALQAINSKLLDEFVTKQRNQIVLRKSLYKTLASPEKNLPFPNFTAENMYKAKAFDNTDEVLDLLYAINYSTRATISERDIKIIILPKGNGLTADQIEEFFERDRDEKKSNAKKLSEQRIAEERLAPEQNKSLDDFFDRLLPNALFEAGANINSFDFIFSKAGGVSAPDVDMIELAGLDKSHLRAVGEFIAKVRLEVEGKRNKLIKSKKDLNPLDVQWSFSNILGDVTKDKKKYQSHLLKVLPQIYAGTYTRDELLLPTFIEKNEFNIRNENPTYSFLKFDYEFLTRLRKGGDEEMNTMNDSPSYNAGKLLGKLAQPVSWEIKSFEKNYVGLLSRRISDKEGVIAFSNFINEKLAIHERAYPSLKEKFIELSGWLSAMKDTDYHRDYCAFGFFEGYFGKPDIPVKAGETGNEESQPT